MKPPALHVIAHADLGPDLQAQILAVCSDAYEEDFAEYLRLLDQATHVLAIEGGRVVAHAAWVPRELRVGAARTPLACAYVEAVATPRALQGRGLGTAVLRAIPPLLAGHDLAALSPSEPAFYARCGWEAWQGPMFHLQDGRRIFSGDEGLMIHRLPRTPATLDLSAEIETDWREGEVW